jgi:hypothetical protein
MRRAVFIMAAIGCLVSPIAVLAQPSGGTGNHEGPASAAGAPTIEDNIDVARQEIEKAREGKAISAHKADSAERKLKLIEHKLEHLFKEVSEIRHSLP